MIRGIVVGVLGTLAGVGSGAGFVLWLMYRIAADEAAPAVVEAEH